MSESTPPRLYKYCSPNRLTVLQDGLIRFTQPGDLNDPFEIRPVLRKVLSSSEETTALRRCAVDATRELLGKDATPTQVTEMAELLLTRARSHMNPYISALTEQMISVVNNQFFPNGANQALGVMSLTEDPSSLLMWGHYTNSYQGFVLELDSTSDFFQVCEGVHEDIVRARKVPYSTKRPHIDLTTDEVSIDVLFTKPIEWKYEREWRLLRPLSKATKIDKKAPFAIHLFEIPTGCIRSVIVGYRMSKEDFEQVSLAIQTLPFLAGTTLRAVRMHETEFSLEVVDVKDWDDLRTDEIRAESAKSILSQILDGPNRVADRVVPIRKRVAGQLRKKKRRRKE